MTQKRKKEVLSEIELMYEKLEEAYELAGGIRDSYSSIGAENCEGVLKEFTNEIRGKIYEIRTNRGNHRRLANLILCE